MTPRPEDGRTTWDTVAYDSSHSFVYEYGAAVVSLLDPQPDERILDIGCGTGHLTNKIRNEGASVVGVDTSAQMIRAARHTYPGIRFVLADGVNLPFDESFDAVFSNATLHWISNQDAVIESIASVLKPDGRFVAELGGSGNVAAILDPVLDRIADKGYTPEHSWHFPSIGEYATRLERHGFEVQYATLFDRPTTLDEGKDGLANWLDMFGDDLLAPLSPAERRDIVTSVEDDLRSEHYDDGAWTVDYRRLRFVAVLTA